MALATAVGMVLAVAFSRILRQMLYSVTPLDGVTFVLVPFIVVTTAAIACGVPAWRATRVDPLVALRRE